MPSETQSYKGHTIHIVVSEDKRGGWSWYYTIDGAAHYERMQESRPNGARELAVSEAFNAAKWRIDSMK
ncbi:hypothetical protein [Archangium violaceum]|uniref:hypothetical protein n=1 Tax=Archangium violaceum TaxID=83451 RepID=UPI0036DB38E4